ncbi:MAG: hypothetical protein JSW18_04700 [Candidatus Omnitrophota bacterium]|nr:MAG: hypothetical protein JSW18_04700 [Candidatus Omnitrophota bacterium]
MKKIIGGIRIFWVILCITSFIFYADFSYAKEQPRSISMDFQGVALRDVLKVFSQQAGLNFVAVKEIEDKKVTLYLDGVTVQDALTSILEANNLTYEQKPESSIFIVKESTMPKIKMVTKVYSLNYADANGEKSDIKPIIENLLTKDNSGGVLGSIVNDVRTNSLIITSVPENFPLIENTLAKLDTRTKQIMIEAEIVEVKTTAIKKIGLDWGGATTGEFFTFTGPARDTRFPFIRESSPFARKLLSGALGTGTPTTTSTTTATSTVATTAATTGATLGNLTLAQFRIVLKALEKENKSKYLAKPKIMVINNETAEIRISANAGVGTTTTEGESGTLTTSVERVETGVILKVTPTVNKDDYITMTLEPEVSSVKASSVTGYYDPTKRAAKTTVIMKDGQTIAIGGLLKSEVADNDRAVPGLSKVPLLGNLFKSKDFEDVETELIIFVTCHIVKPELEKLEEAAAPPSVKLKKETAIVKRDKEIIESVKRLRKRREINETVERGKEIVKAVKHLRKIREITE